MGEYVITGKVTAYCTDFPGYKFYSPNIQLEEKPGKERQKKKRRAALPLLYSLDFFRGILLRTVKKLSGSRLRKENIFPLPFPAGWLILHFYPQ